MSFCLLIAPTPFICCKARLVTRVLSVCLHDMYNIKAVNKIEIITAMNRKNICIKIIEKGIFVRQF